MKQVRFLKTFRPWHVGVVYDVLEGDRWTGYRGPKGVPQDTARDLTSDGVCRDAVVFRAQHHYARISARKVRAMAELVRGKQADEALNILRYQPHRGARMLEKVIKSALGNAEDLRTRNIGQLRVVDARVDGGPMFKRMRPRARGMAHIIKKRTSHIRVELE